MQSASCWRYTEYNYNQLRWLKPMFLSQNIFAEIACSMRWIRPLRPEQRGALWLCKAQETQETRNSTNTHQTENHNMHMAFSNSVTSVTEYDLVLPIARPQHFCFAATRGERSVEKRWRTHVSICFSFCFSWRPWTCLRYHQTYGHM